MNTKKTRALPRVWARFYKLRKGDTFSLGKQIVQKYNCLCSQGFTVGGSPCTPRFFPPWRRVRTTTLVRDVLPGGKSGYDHVGTVTHRTNAGENVETLQLVFGLTQPTDDNRTGPSA